MKHLILLLSFMSFMFLPCMASDTDAVISGVQHVGNWIYVYDEKGEKCSSMSASNRKIVGIASNSFVVVNGNWIYTFDIKCNWIYTYDRKCKKK